MKKRKKIVSRLLCAALITATLPIGTPTVYAAEEAAEPSKTAYADKAGLEENYDLSKDTLETEKSVQRVFFGKDGNGNQQKWKIAGKDNEIKDGDGNTIDNIVLFADSAIKPPGGDADGKIKFDKDWDHTKSTAKDYPTAETDRAALGITYVKNNYSFIPTKVYVNHYGTSTLRSELRSMAGSTNYFTTAQQALMNPTTITTEDTYTDPSNGEKNGNYTTKDILYAGYGNFDDDQHITVGTNKEIGGSLDKGLKIDMVINGVDIWEKDNKSFWLRAPSADNAYNALVAAPASYCMGSSYVDVPYSVVPAFDLNLTNVLFASSAPTTEAGAKKLSGSDAMTFRWADETGENARIKSTATWNASEVNVTKGSGEGDVYLCVQGNNGGTDWIWSQKVSEISGNKVDVQTVTSDVKKIDSLTDPKVELAQCKIWLETTDTNEDLTYAKQAKKLAKPVTNTQFAKVGDLMTFDTDESDGSTNPAKVYFGQNGSKAQAWWIAGVDEKIEDENGKKIEKNIVLFAESPLASGIQFNASTGSKTYDTDWNCGYPSNSSMTGKQVNANHYGGSTLRNNTLKNLETDTNYFTSEEQKLMNATTVYTQDTANVDSGQPLKYSTTDKLYLAYSAGYGFSRQHIMVGANSAAGLDSGLRVDMNYWGDNDAFWLRAPYDGNGNYALYTLPSSFVYDCDVSSPLAAVPAFNFNLTSVLFGSAAPAATKEGKLDTKDVTNNGAFTLRYKSDSIGTATLSTDKKSVSISGVNNANTYLVAQNSEGAQAKKVSDGDVISIDDMYPDLATFENCHIWLETTDDNARLTYAATAKPKAQTPALSEDNITRKKNSLSIKTDGFDTATYGPIQYRCQQADAKTNTRTVDWTEGTEISGLQAGTKYTVAIRYKGNDNYLPSDPSEVTISTLEDTGNTDTDSSTGETTPDTDKTYDSNKDGGPEVTKTGNTGGQAGSKSDPEGSSLVQTGDESSPALWIALMLIALAVAGGTVSCGRRKRAR